MTQFQIRRPIHWLVFVALSFFAPLSSANENGRENSLKPNIVLIYADDVDCESVFGQFPKQEATTVKFDNLKMMAQQGVRFSNFHVTTPVCGPSRACLYTGQYAHHNQCRVNNPSLPGALGFSGGYKTFNPENELASWMKAAGYATAHVGKYLHSDFNPDYPNGIKWRDIVPAGWDHFRVSLGSKYFGFPCYIKSSDSITKDLKGEYRTDWDVRNAIEVIQKHAHGAERKSERKPLFLCWTPIAAHITMPGEPMSATRHKSLYSNRQIPQLQERLKARVTNPIDELKVLPVPDADGLTRMQDTYRDRLRATQSIDEGIGRLRAELQENGMLKNTIFIFTSDHGFQLSHHLHYGKRLPYDRITRVPFLVTGPGIPWDRQCDSLLANIDIAPTLLRLAGVEPPKSCDGISFDEQLFEPEQKLRSDRDAILIENWGHAVSLGTELPATYSSIRTHDKIYTEWATGGREFYDLAADPDQSVNLYEELNEEQQRDFANRLRKLRATDYPPKFTNTQCLSSIRNKRICGNVEPVVFSGFVESDSGTKSVELEVRCKQKGWYWTGDGWSRERFRLPAILASPKGMVSQWKFALDTSNYARGENADLYSKDVGISVIATDLKQRETTDSNVLEYMLSFTDPETVLDDFHFDSSKKRLTASGTAISPSVVTAVRVGILHDVTRQYWNGTAWQEKFVQLDAEFSKTDAVDIYQWSLDVPLPQSASVLLIARAYSKFDNSDQTPAVKRFER